MTAFVDKSWVEVMQVAIADALFDLHTGLPAKVISFDAQTQTCNVQPLLKRVYLDGDEKPVERDVPAISNVPVHYDAGGGWAITFPLQQDDLVYLTFAERSLDRWLESDGSKAVDPVDARLHPLDGAVAIPGVRPRRRALAGLAKGGLRLGREDGSTEIVVDTSGKVTIKATAVAIINENASKSYVLGEDLIQFLIGFAGVFNTHVHPSSVGPTGPAQSPAPGGAPVPGIQALPTAAALLSTKIKGE